MTSPALRSLVVASSLAFGVTAQTRMISIGGANELDRLGSAASSAGDVDRDGFDDVLVGAPTAWTDAPFSGWAGLYSGRNGELLRSWNGTSAFQGFGGAMCALGDIDGDAWVDYAISGMGDRTNGPSCGRVFVYSGRTGQAMYDFLGEGPGDLFGHALANARDVDRDGVNDLIVGAPENGDPVENYGPGYAKVYSGRTGAVLHRWSGRLVTVEFGQAVDGVGDVDGDGYADVVVGAVLDSVRNGVGAARVYSGRTGAVLHVLTGIALTDHFAVSAIGIGDTDGDGISEIAVGAAEMGTRLPGNVTVFSGRTGAPLFRVVAQEFMQMFGVSLAATGDVDGDGAPDFAVGSPGSFEMRGAVFIHSGRDGRLLRTIQGSVQGTMFGFPAAVAGDVNKDGARELIVGSRGERGARGAAHVFACGNVASIGAGCGTQAPTLTSTPWQIGTRAELEFTGGERNARAALFASFLPSMPTLLSGSCTFYLDAASLLPIGHAQLNAHGRGRRRIDVPAAPELVDAALMLQATLSSRVDPIALSNGVIVRVQR